MSRLPAPHDDETSKMHDELNDTVSRDLNLFGVFSLGISLAAFMVLCHSLGGDNNAIVIPLATAVSSALVYGWNEKFWTKAPLVSWNATMHNRIWAIYLIQFLSSFSVFGVSNDQHFGNSRLIIKKLLSNTSEFFTRTINASATFSGATFIVVTFGCIIGSVAFGFLIRL